MCIHPDEPDTNPEDWEDDDSAPVDDGDGDLDDGSNDENEED